MRAKCRLRLERALGVREAQMRPPFSLRLTSQTLYWSVCCPLTERQAQREVSRVLRY